MATNIYFVVSCVVSILNSIYATLRCLTLTLQLNLAAVAFAHGNYYPACRYNYVFSSKIHVNCVARKTWESKENSTQNVNEHTRGLPTGNFISIRFQSRKSNPECNLLQTVLRFSVAFKSRRVGSR